jgi:hypothetical protein
MTGDSLEMMNGNASIRHPCQTGVPEVVAA